MKKFNSRTKKSILNILIKRINYLSCHIKKGEEVDRKANKRKQRKEKMNQSDTPKKDASGVQYDEITPENIGEFL